MNPREYSCCVEGIDADWVEMQVTPMQLLTRKKFTEQEISAYQKSLKFDFIRIVLQQSMEALAFCHARSVVSVCCPPVFVLCEEQRQEFVGTKDIQISHYMTEIRLMLSCQHIFATLALVLVTCNHAPQSSFSYL